MNTNDLIIKKRNGAELSKEEYSYLIKNYVSGVIPDYQMSALLMAIYFRGMTERETLCMTEEMIKSGDTLDLGGVKGVKADKHSTGGVGDKTSLALCPMLASLGIRIAKMSGRGLGHTGGTIDKLESFPGLTTTIDGERFIRQANEIGFVIAGQTAHLVPADKKLYALRDVTGTVDILPLIVSSIMSKKLASGADIIVLDVKTGNGAFMKREEDSFELARQMVALGRNAGKKTVAVVSDMDEPLGFAVGNALEVREAIDVLKGGDAGYLRELCLALGSCVLIEAGMAGNEEMARGMLEKCIEDGSALKKLADFVEAQGGDRRAVYDTSLLPEAPVKRELRSQKAGYIKSLHADNVGRACIALGGGRETKDSAIDLSVGVVLHKKKRNYVNQNESLLTIYAHDEKSAVEAERILLDSYEFSETLPEETKFIKGIVR
ncbi:MAG: thymidine phosphorylase [Oscillospiraceae bacterium]|nr:thymidine phosphorylase [Oscillospiraceae bacterium]